jgi:hypothetical protein
MRRVSVASVRPLAIYRVHPQFSQIRYLACAIGFGKTVDPTFNAVHDIAVGRDGSIYVAETRTKRLVKLRPVAPSRSLPVHRE